ncbi:MAG: type IV secretion system DNA-binding domain-containing protein [Pirellulales bacterium]|nr:type IV secretion system DNA-binding domain-containing protein [Pirellulales bacterium]
MSTTIIACLRKLLGFRGTTPAIPHDPDFWRQLGHHELTAIAIAQCFSEYWIHKGAAKPESKARYCLRRLTGEIPISCDNPQKPSRSFPDHMLETHPLHWCVAYTCFLYPLSQAVEIARIAAVRRCHDRQLAYYRLVRQDFDVLRATQVAFALKFRKNRTPVEPSFWRQIGHNPPHSRRLIRCCPEYWFPRTKPSWRKAVCFARRSLKRLGLQLEKPDHNFYELAAIGKADIRRRDPAYWYMQGHDWNEALLKAVHEAFGGLCPCAKEFFQIRRLIKDAESEGELLADGNIHVAGPHLGFQDEYEFLQQRRRHKTSRRSSPQWGPLKLTSKASARAHCCAIGLPGAGTDTLLHVLMDSVRKSRWLVVDGGHNLLPAVLSARPAEHVFLLNPFDARACGWSIAEDAANLSQIQQLVAAILPDDPSSDATILESARQILTALIVTFNRQAPGKWGLSHLFAALQENSLAVVLSSSPDTSRLFDLLATTPHLSLVAEYLHAKLAPLQPLAAASRRAARHVSISAWLQSSSALVLACHQPHQSALASVNRIILRLLTSRMLEVQPRSRRTRVFISDLDQVGRLDGLVAMLTQGAANGISVALTVTDLDILQRYYGSEATGILSLCDNYAILRTNNPSTARWASQLIGTETIKMLHKTKGTLSGKTSRGMTITTTERLLVPPAAFQALPLQKDNSLVVGFFKTHGRRIFRGQITRSSIPLMTKSGTPTTEVASFIPSANDAPMLSDEADTLLQDLGFPISESSARSCRKNHDRMSHSAKTPMAAPMNDSDFDMDDFPRIRLPRRKD